MFVSVHMVGVSSPTGAFPFDFPTIGFVEGWWSLTVAPDLFVGDEMALVTQAFRVCYSHVFFLVCLPSAA